MQCFSISSKDIEGRIDPHFYRLEFINLKSDLGKVNYKRLGDLIEFSNETWNQNDYYDNEFPYIEISEIDIFTGDIKNITYYEKKDAPSRAKMIVRENDIIISTTRPHRGAISLISKNEIGFIASTGFAILRELKTDLILRKYLYFYLRTNLSLNQMLQRSSGGNYPAITSDELKKIIVPTPSKENQLAIIGIMENAVLSNKNKKLRNLELQNSINDYILSELGITLPILQNKMTFKVNSNEIINKRLDPKAHSQIPKDILKSINNSKYQKVSLLSLVKESFAGEWGIDTEFNKPNETQLICNVIRNTNFENQNNLSFEDVAQRILDKSKFNKVKLQNNDLLIEKSGGSPVQPVGRVALFEKEDKNENYTISNFLQVFRIDESKCLPEYLFYYLKSIYKVGYMEYLQNQTTGIKNLIMEEYLGIPVVLPALSIQNKIAEEVKSRLDKTRLLKDEANKILSDAKQKIEEMILG